VDLIALREQIFGQVGAVLAGDAGDECFFHAKPPLLSQSASGWPYQAGPQR
jgi:hypothetical protein